MVKNMNVMFKIWSLKQYKELIICFLILMFIAVFGLGPNHFIMNIDYEGFPVGDLSDPSLSFWVHHVPYILPQVSTSILYSLV